MKTAANVLGQTWFATEIGPDGTRRPITRVRVCECTRQFTQHLLSPTQCASWERQGVITNVLAQIPDLFVPVRCPGCESKELGRQARIDEARARSRWSA